MNKISKLTAVFLVLFLFVGGVFLPGNGNGRLCHYSKPVHCLGPWLDKPRSITYFFSNMPVFNAKFTHRYNARTRMLNALGRSVFLSFYFDAYTRQGSKFDQIIELKELIYTFTLNSPKFRFFGDSLSSQESMNLFLLGYYIEGLERAGAKAGADNNLEQALAFYDGSVTLFQLFKAVRKTLNKNAVKIYGDEWAQKMLEYYDGLMNEVEAGLPRGTKTQARGVFKPDVREDIERYIMTMLNWSRTRAAENDDSGYDLQAWIGDVVHFSEMEKGERASVVTYMCGDKPDFEYFILFNPREDVAGNYRVGRLDVFLEPGQIIMMGIGKDGEIDYVFNSLDNNKIDSPQNWDWFISGPAAASIQCAA